MLAANRGPGNTFMIYRILLVVLAASTLWWLYRVKDGEQEFRESQQALRQVTSWRQESRIGSQGKEQAEIVCPDHGHWLRHATSQSTGDQTFESFELGTKSYSRSQERPSEWISEYVAPVISACEKLRHGDYLYPLPDYGHLLEHTRISKGAVDTVQGLKCQEWTTTRTVSGRFAAGQPLDDAQICIGLHDHLPRRIKYANAEYIFYDWNAPIQIEGSHVLRAPLP
jgi:hypothetical protein